MKCLQEKRNVVFFSQGKGLGVFLSEFAWQSQPSQTWQVMRGKVWKSGEHVLFKVTVMQILNCLRGLCMDEKRGWGLCMKEERGRWKKGVKGNTVKIFRPWGAKVMKVEREKQKHTLPLLCSTFFSCYTQISIRFWLKKSYLTSYEGWLGKKGRVMRVLSCASGGNGLHSPPLSRKNMLRKAVLAVRPLCSLHSSN